MRAQKVKLPYILEMAFWNRKNKFSDEDMRPLFDDWEPPVEKPTYIKEEIQPSALFNDIMDQVQKIKDGDESVLPSFLSNLSKFHKTGDVSNDESDLAFFSSQLMEEDGFELSETKWLFQSEIFIIGILKLLNYELHYLCWLLLTGEYSTEILHKMLVAAEKSEYGLECEECGQAFWWSHGCVLNYLMTQENLSASDIKRIHKLNLEIEDNLLNLGIANHKNTPKEIVETLIDLDVIVYLEDTHPWFEKIKSTNIGEVAKARF